MIHIVNLEISNVASVANMLRKAGCERVVMTNDPEALASARKIILPGVGSFDHAMKAIDKFSLKNVLSDKVLREKVPILGICLGMQLFFRRSQEGQEHGLGWIEGAVVRFDRDKFTSNDARVPHMGWNTVRVRKPSKLFTHSRSDPPISSNEPDRFYFTHSYHAVCIHQDDVLAETDHGYRFVSAVEKNNIYGVQFHPEKSHRFGFTLLKAFHELT